MSYILPAPLLALFLNSNIEKQEEKYPFSVPHQTDIR